MKLRALGSWLIRAHPPMLVARLVVGGVYVWLGVNKVLEPIAFLKALREYDVFPLAPPEWMNLTVVVLPWIEIVCGVLLLAGAWLRAASTLLLVMTVTFTVVVTARAMDEAALQGVGLCAVSFDCGCGTGVVAFCRKFAENVGLSVLAAVVVMSSSRFLAVDSPRSRVGAAPAAV